jgi:nucleoside triphosphate pyrophosphatase
MTGATEQAVSEIYLASTSPRRQALLGQLGISFEVIAPDVAEQRLADESAATYVKRMAAEKARQVARLVQQRRLPSRPVLAADTCILLDQEILGKPRDREHGETMLRRLSGREHTVLTAAVIVHANAEHLALSVSKVCFRVLTEDEIVQYWNTGEPCDKAGAYALQGRAAAFVSNINGSYSGIVGLPLYEVAQLLQQIGSKLA